MQSNSPDKIPMTHQFAGNKLYCTKPGVSIVLKAAAMGLILSAFSTVENPNGESLPTQISKEPAHMTIKIRYVVTLAEAVLRKKLLTVALNRIVNTLVTTKQIITWMICSSSTG
jgi:hypothetical protein